MSVLDFVRHERTAPPLEHTMPSPEHNLAAELVDSVWPDGTPVTGADIGGVYVVRIHTGSVVVDSPDMLARRPETDTREHSGVKAVKDLKAWLGVTVTDVLAYSGLQSSTYYWWQSHPEAELNPNKGGVLIRLHGLASTMLRFDDQQGLRDWWQAQWQLAKKTDNPSSALLEACYAWLASLTPTAEPLRRHPRPARGSYVQSPHDAAALLRKEWESVGLEFETEAD